MECFVEQVQIVGRTNEFGKTGGEEMVCSVLNEIFAFSTRPRLVVTSTTPLAPWHHKWLLQRHPSKPKTFRFRRVQYHSCFWVHRPQVPVEMYHPQRYLRLESKTLRYHIRVHPNVVLQSNRRLVRQDCYSGFSEGTTISFGLMELIETTTLSFSAVRSRLLQLRPALWSLRSASH